MKTTKDCYTKDGKFCSFAENFECTAPDESFCSVLEDAKCTNKKGKIPQKEATGTLKRLLDKTKKERVQPKQEWSKEDERLLNNMVIVIQDYYNKEDAQSLISWLKSLKQRIVWKPSLAQMNVLSIVSKGNAPDDIDAIQSLYNDLKKLKEEQL